MKNITKKGWGIAGTSIGSLLIIVALLTMVGIGSNDTYSASVVQCTCTSGTYDSSTGKCVKTTTTTTMCCGAGQACSTYSTCSSTSGCTYTGGGAYSCPKTTTSTTACTCPSGTTSNGSGGCVTASSPGGSSSSGTTTTVTTCEGGKYYGGPNSCISCPAGYYCPGGTFGTSYGSVAGSSGKRLCPDNATCGEGASTFTCNSGYQKSGSSACVKNSDSSKTICAPKTYYDGSNACIDCPAGFYCPGGTFSHETADINGSGKRSCPENATCPANSSTFLCNTGYIKSGDTCVKTSSGDSGSGGTGTGGSGSGGTGSGGTGSGGTGSGGTGSGGTGSGGTGSGGSAPSTPSNPSQGTGGNGNGGNSSNVNNNPHTATKAPLVVAVIGMLSMGLGTFAYFKGKKEINTEI